MEEDYDDEEESILQPPHLLVERRHTGVRAAGEKRMFLTKSINCTTTTTPRKD